MRGAGFGDMLFLIMAAEYNRLVTIVIIEESENKFFYSGPFWGVASNGEADRIASGKGCAADGGAGTNRWAGLDIGAIICVGCGVSFGI